MPCCSNPVHINCSFAPRRAPLSLCCLAELNAELGNFEVLVPDEQKRRSYVRVFKWVVAFATWRFVKTPEEAAVHEQHKKVGSSNGSRNL